VGNGPPRSDANALVQAPKGAFHGPTVLQQVAHAAGTAGVVLQDEVFAPVIANEVRSADVDVDVPGNLNVREFAPKVLPRQDVMRRDDAVFHDALFVIDVMEKQIQGRNALHQAMFHALPFPCRDDARDQIKGEDPFSAARIAIHVKRDALTQEREVHGAALGLQILRYDLGERFAKLGVMRQRPIFSAEHFVKKASRRVRDKAQSRRFRFSQPVHSSTVKSNK